MTDKEKIREYIEELHNTHKGSSGDWYFRLALRTVLHFIDSLQEEPSIPEIVDEHYWEMLGEEPISNPIDFEQELYKAFGQVKDFTLGMRIAKWFYDMGKKSREPVSKDLEEAAEKYIHTQDSGDYHIRTHAFKAGAEWQKEQNQSTIELAEDHAMLAGMEKMKEEMMKKAVEVTVHIDAGGYPYIPQIELYDYDKDVPLAKEGDKYKVVLIKEE